MSFAFKIKHTKEEKINRRNELIRNRFCYLINEKHYSTDYALTILENEFLPLSSQTIWLIVSETGYYKGR